MIRRTLFSAALGLAVFVLPLAANAQGVPEGADHGGPRR